MPAVNASNANRREIVELGTMPGLELPSPSKIVLPAGLIPSCPQHCSRHDIECWLECTVCRNRPYVLIEHRWFHNTDMIFYTTEPRNGAPALARGQMPTCCGAPLTRVTA